MKNLCLLLVILSMLITSGCLTTRKSKPELAAVPMPLYHEIPKTNKELQYIFVEEQGYKANLLWWIFKTLKIVDKENEDISWLEQELKYYIKEEPE